jgi:hypothetical protein
MRATKNIRGERSRGRTTSLFQQMKNLLSKMKKRVAGSGPNHCLHSGESKRRKTVPNFAENI